MSIVAASVFTNAAQAQSNDRGSIKGTWAVKSMKLADKSYGSGEEPLGMPKIGSLYKFRSDGTCLYNNGECTYKYSQEDKELIISQSIAFGLTTYTVNHDVRFTKVDGAWEMTLKWTQVGQKFEMVFKED
jgi:hypothetical protein